MENIKDRISDYRHKLFVHVKTMDESGNPKSGLNFGQ
jgi:hypothetical protein